MSGNAWDVPPGGHNGQGSIQPGEAGSGVPFYDPTKFQQHTNPTIEPPLTHNSIMNQSGGASNLNYDQNQYYQQQQQHDPGQYAENAYSNSQQWNNTNYQSKQYGQFQNADQPNMQWPGANPTSGDNSAMGRIDSWQKLDPQEPWGNDTAWNVSQGDGYNQQYGQYQGAQYAESQPYPSYNAGYQQLDSSVSSSDLVDSNNIDNTAELKQNIQPGFTNSPSQDLTRNKETQQDHINPDNLLDTGVIGRSVSEISNSSLQTINFSRETSRVDTLENSEYVSDLANQMHNSNLGDGSEEQKYETFNHFRNAEHDVSPFDSIGANMNALGNEPGKGFVSQSVPVQNPDHSFQVQQTHGRNDSLGVNFVIGSDPNSGTNSRSDSRTQVDSHNASPRSEVPSNTTHPGDSIVSVLEQQQKTAVQPCSDASTSGAKVYDQARPPSVHSNVSGSSHEDFLSRKSGAFPQSDHPPLLQSTETRSDKETSQQERPPSQGSLNSSTGYVTHDRPLSVGSHHSIPDQPPLVGSHSTTAYDRPPSVGSYVATSYERPSSTGSFNSPRHDRPLATGSSGNPRHAHEDAHMEQHTAPLYETERYQNVPTYINQLESANSVHSQNVQYPNPAQEYGNLQPECDRTIGGPVLMSQSAEVSSHNQYAAPPGGPDVRNPTNFASEQYIGLPRDAMADNMSFNQNDVHDTIGQPMRPANAVISPSMEQHKFTGYPENSATSQIGTIGEPVPLQHADSNLPIQDHAVEPYQSQHLGQPGIMGNPEGRQHQDHLDQAAHGTKNPLNVSQGALPTLQMPHHNEPPQAGVDPSSPDLTVNIFAQPIQARKDSPFQPPPHRHTSGDSLNSPRHTADTGTKPFCIQQGGMHSNVNPGDMEQPQIYSQRPEHGSTDGREHPVGQQSNQTGRQQSAVNVQQSNCTSSNQPAAYQTQNQHMGSNVPAEQQNIPYSPITSQLQTSPGHHPGSVVRKVSAEKFRQDNNLSPATTLWENPELPKVPVFLAPVAPGSHKVGSQPETTIQHSQPIVPLNVSQIQQSLEREMQGCSTSQTQNTGANVGQIKRDKSLGENKHGSNDSRDRNFESQKEESDASGRRDNEQDRRDDYNRRHNYERRDDYDRREDYDRRDDRDRRDDYYRQKGRGNNRDDRRGYRDDRSDRDRYDRDRYDHSKYDRHRDYDSTRHPDDKDRYRAEYPGSNPSTPESKERRDCDYDPRYSDPRDNRDRDRYRGRDSGDRKYRDGGDRDDRRRHREERCNRPSSRQGDRPSSRNSQNEYSAYSQPVVNPQQVYMAREYYDQMIMYGYLDARIPFETWFYQTYGFSLQGSRPSSRQGSRSNTPAFGETSSQGSRPSSRQEYGYDSYGFDTQQIKAKEIAQGRLTPPKHRTTHVKAVFSICGNLIQTLPDSVLINVMSDVCMADPDTELLKAFPGPLIKNETHKFDVLSFCQSKIKQTETSTDLVDKDSVLLIWNLCVMLIKQNGVAVGTDISQLLLEGHEHSTSEYKETNLQANVRTHQPPTDNVLDEGHNTVTFDRSVVSQASKQDSTVDRFRHLLLYGRKKDALLWAQKNHLWGYALFLASKMDQRTHSTVLTAFANQIWLNDPLQTLFQLMSARPPAAATSLGDSRWGDWRPHLAMMLSNATDNPNLDYRAIVTLGDTLASRGLLHAAQFCYLICQTPFGQYDKKSSKIVLIGSNHNLAFNEFATTEAIQLTEIFEFSQTLNNPLNHFVTFLPYKLVYTNRLLDVGLFVEALRYVEAISNTICQMPGAYSYTVVKQTYELGQRLKYQDPTLLQSGEYFEDPPWLVQMIRIIQAFEEGAIQPLSGTQTPMSTSSEATQDQQYNQAYDHQPQQSMGYDPNQQYYQTQTQSAVSYTGQPDNSTAQNQIQLAGAVYESHPEGTAPNVAEQRRASVMSLKSQQGQPTYIPPLNLADSVGSYLGESYNSQYTTTTANSDETETEPESPRSNSMNSQDYYSQMTSMQKPLDRQVSATSSTGSGIMAKSDSPNLNPTTFNFQSRQVGAPPVSGTSNAVSPRTQHYGQYAYSQPPQPMSAGQQMPSETTKKADAPKPPAANKDKKKEHTEPKKSGWFSGIISKFQRKDGVKEMFLPDDSDKTIIWDERLSKWVNTGANEVEEEKAPPPPKDLQVAGPPGGNAPGTGPPVGTSKFSLKARASRNQYVDIFGSTASSAPAPTGLFDVLPSAPTANTNYFVPPPVPASDSGTELITTPAMEPVPGQDTSQNDDAISRSSSLASFEVSQITNQTAQPQAVQAPMFFDPSNYKTTTQSSPGGGRLSYGQRRAYPK